MIEILANKLLGKLGFQQNVKGPADCDHSFFVDIFEQTLSEKLPGLIDNPEEKEEKIHNVQVVIDQLAAEVLGVDLSHIEAQCIVEGSEVHVQNLLEIFDGLLDLVMEDLDEDEDEDERNEKHQQQESDAMDDSNMIADDHEVLSDVFLQEDIPHYSTMHGSTIAEKPLSPGKKAFVTEKMQHYQTTTRTVVQPKAINSSNGINSTNELICEAEILEKRKHNRPSNKTEKIPPPPQYEGEGEVNDWSNILTQTNSAVESFSDCKEIGVRPRRQLGAEKRQQEAEEGDDPKQSVFLHTHTHHHYHHKHDNPSTTKVFDNNSFSSSSSSTSSSSSKKLSSNPLKKLSQEPTINTCNDNTSSTSFSSSSNKKVSSNPMTKIGADNHSLTSTSTATSSKKSLINQQDDETITTGPGADDNSSSTSSSFLFTYNEPVTMKTTNKSRRNKQNVGSLVQTDALIDVKTTRPSHKEFLKSLHESSMAENTTTRSRQLSELSSRLQNLRDELRAPVSEKAEFFSVGQQEEDKENNPVPTGETKTKGRRGDKSKVSFASEVMIARRNDIIHGCSSDTEIDYSSPISVKVTKRKFQPHKKKKDLFAELARKRFSSTEDEETSRRRIPWKQHDRVSKRKPQVDRDDRLKEIQHDYKSDNLEKKRQLKQIRHDYSQQRQALAGGSRWEGKANKQTNLEQPKSICHRDPVKKVPKKAAPYPSETDYATHLANIYKKTNKPAPRGRNSGDPSSQNKCRKRSASSSPVGRRRYKSRLVLYEDEILPAMQEEFPFLQLSSHTAKLMWQKQMRQVHTLCKAARLNRPSKVQKQIEEAQRKQEMLSRIIQKELDHNNRLKKHKEHKFEEGLIKKKLAERRQRSARARKYYDEYAVRNKSRMLNKRCKEEKIFKKLFEDGLEIQKERLRELKSYAREQREKNEKHQQNEIESMENYYRGQFSMLAETISQEKHDLQVRQKAQNQLLLKMRREMRKKMEDDIETIQDQLINEQDSASFRQIDADNMRKEFQLATFKSTKF